MNSNLTDYWKLIKPSREWEKENPYITGIQKSGEENNRPEHQDRTDSPIISAVLKNSIQMKNIGCYDADGKVTEEYDVLLLMRDIQKDKTWAKLFSLETAVADLGSPENKMFLPSAALTCNILHLLYKNRDDLDVRKTLNQYQVEDCHYAKHIQNSLIYRDLGLIAHYPRLAAITSIPYDIAPSEIKIKTAFRMGYDNISLDWAVRSPKTSEFVRNLTGLKNPESILDICDYFGKKGYFRNNIEKWGYQVSIGCSEDYFYISFLPIEFNHCIARGIFYPNIGQPGKRK